MQNRRDRLHAVDQPWAGPHNEPIGIDRPHLSVGETNRNVTSLVDRAREMKAAWRDQYHVWGLRHDAVPACLHRPLPRSARYGNPARGTDQVRHPVPSREWRVDPLDHCHPRARSSRNALNDHGQSRAQFTHEGMGLRQRPGSLPN